MLNYRWEATHELCDAETGPSGVLVMVRDGEYFTREVWEHGGRAETIESLEAAGSYARFLHEEAVTSNAGVA